MKLIVELDLDFIQTPHEAGAVLMDAGKHLQHLGQFRHPESGKLLYGELNRTDGFVCVRMMAVETPFINDSMIDPAEPISYKAKATVDTTDASTH